MKVKSKKAEKDFMEWFKLEESNRIHAQHARETLERIKAKQETLRELFKM